MVPFRLSPSVGRSRSSPDSLSDAPWMQRNGLARACTQSLTREAGASAKARLHERNLLDEASIGLRGGFLAIQRRDVCAECDAIVPALRSLPGRMEARHLRALLAPVHVCGDQRID